MTTDHIKQQETKFTSAQKKFEGAKKEYMEAVQEYRAFSDPELVESTASIMRAAYSDRMAWMMAVMSKLAYIEFEESEEELARLQINLNSGGFDLVSTFSSGSTQAFLAKNNNIFVLAFRGTEPSKSGDIQTDMRLYKKRTQEGKVHSGFHEAYQQISNELEKSFMNQENWIWPLYITGHSLGGALATIATQHLEHKIKSQIAACYTFGSPRVGNEQYEQNIRAPFYRVVHSTDIVSLIPTIGYRHVGDTRFLTYCGPDSKNFKLYRGIPIFRRFWEMILAAIIPRNWSRWVDSHSKDEYERKLRIYAKERNK
jgi:hypothetical protein